MRSEPDDTAPPPLLARRVDIDWLRIIAMFLLIVTHTIFVYTTTWRIESSHAGRWGDLIVMVMGPWRMSLVFFIGGIATRFLLLKYDFSHFTTNRLHRLMLPFIVAIIVIVPPMNFVRIDNVGMPEMTYLEFMGQYWRAYTQLFGVSLPDFGPAWFLPYLFTYAVGAAILWNFARNAFSATENKLGAAPIGVLLLIVCTAYVFSNQKLLEQFGWSNNIIRSFTDHIRFLPVFLVGLFVAHSKSFWERLQNTRFIVWFLAPALLVATLVATSVRLNLASDDTPAWSSALLVVPGLYAGVMILAISAAGARWLTRSTPSLRYFSDAILPVYLIHQTVMVLVADQILDRQLPLALEFFLIFSSALTVPLIIHHVCIRPYPWIRLAFGLRRNPQPVRTEGPATKPSASSTPKKKPAASHQPQPNR